MESLSPLDGRYGARLSGLASLLSEAGLNRARVRLEVTYLEALVAQVDPEAFRAVPDEAWARLKACGDDELAVIKAYEDKLRHDVKAVEHGVRDRVAAEPALASWAEHVHLGLTSEDVNNLAWGTALVAAWRTQLRPALLDLIGTLAGLAEATADMPMLARTHGQPASPTTLGKELGVFLLRLADALEGVDRALPGGKLTGATGTHGALAVAWPEVDWSAFGVRFVSAQGLEPVWLTTQVEPRDRLAAHLDALRRVAVVVLDLDVDMWRYISDGWFLQRRVADEVGSSAMPHKINPIDFENSEGNLGLAVALLGHMSVKLPQSRLQRDLSDSTVMRNLGVALGHWLLGVTSALAGLGRVAPDAVAMADALSGHHEVLAEAWQVTLRAHGFPEAYERLKEATRGRPGDVAAMRSVLDDPAIPEDLRLRLVAMTPAGFVGLAPELARRAVADVRARFSPR